MKPIYVIIGAALGGFGVWALVRNREQTELAALPEGVKPPEGTTGLPPRPTSPVQPPPTTGVAAPPIPANFGAGLEAIQQRARELHNSKFGRDMALETLLRDGFTGLQYEEAFRRMMAVVWGDVDRFPVVPESIEPQFTRQLEAIKAAAPFRNKANRSSFAAIKVDLCPGWKEWQALRYGSVSIWPDKSAACVPTGALLAELDGGGWGSYVNASDRKYYQVRLERFTIDWKQFVTNVIDLTKRYEQNLQNAAKLELIQNGWKFTD